MKSREKKTCSENWSKLTKWPSETFIGCRASKIMTIICTMFDINLIHFLAYFFSKASFSAFYSASSKASDCFFAIKADSAAAFA